MSWSYVSDEGKELEGVLLVFSTMDDLEANFDDLASHTLAEQQKKKQNGATPTTASSPSPLPRAGSQRDFPPSQTPCFQRASPHPQSQL